MSTRILTREQVKQLVAIGHVLVMLRKEDQLVVVRFNAFASSHPGQLLPVLHFGMSDLLYAPGTTANALYSWQGRNGRNNGSFVPLDR